MTEFCGLKATCMTAGFAPLSLGTETSGSICMPEPHPDQTDLIDPLSSPMTEATASAAKAHGQRAAGLLGIDATLDEHQIDVIIGPGDCAIGGVAALAGYPTGMVPMGRLDGPGGMGQPQGLMLVSRAGGEAKMLEFMQLWETVVGPWKVQAGSSWP
ncbi:hypothetical protein BO71DRAFT_435576 [Aspergillus ellipticus CBS 707.79]|uniref:Amidase domain-containing protein n=1 Tax=Aspergillus ellipticus CBS 707.79 TaxID=1448320 RepID=A0A319CTU9_9EURO|nr:hypothetical protein BO71DRAFT_435576 [Aspergillus ellipticus CBS 707.79]